jgi:hypothetical protein
MPTGAEDGASESFASQAERSGAGEPRLGETVVRSDADRTKTGQQDAHHSSQSAIVPVDHHQAGIIAASLFIALFFLWGGGYKHRTNLPCRIA